MSIVASDSLGFATSGSVFDLGSSPNVGDYDVLGVNSDTTVSTPTGFTLLDSSVVQQGSYLFYRLASGGEGSTVTINTSGDHPAAAVWARVRGATGIDQNAKAVATSSSSGTSPTATTSTLSETGELAIGYAALHRYAGSTPTSPSWSNSFVQLEQGDNGSGATAVTALLGYIEGVGTAAVSTAASWTNGCFDRDTYIVTFTMSAAASQEVDPSGISSGEAFGTAQLNLTVTGTGIASGEAIGSAQVFLQANQNVTVTGISTGEAFGNSSEVSLGYQPILSVQGQLNRIAGTTGLGSQGAANVIAGTTGLATVGALNTYMGNNISDWLDLMGVANQMAGTTGLGTALALSKVAPV